jgi:hypothetical protein
MFTLKGEERNVIAKATVADDYDWGTASIQAYSLVQRLMASNKTSNDVTVAVLDTGLDIAHPYLNGRVEDEGYNFESNNKDITDNFGHGTFMSTIITNATKGLNNIKILPIKVSEGGEATESNFCRAIRYAVDKGADVINISFATPDTPTEEETPFEEAVEYATQNNVVVVASAGNDSKDTQYYVPARAESAITVSAYDIDESPASFSNYGESIDVCAPGVNVVAGFPDAMYGTSSGTSPAAAYVSAEAACLKMMDRTFTPAEISNIISHYSLDRGYKGWDKYYGNGIINWSNVPVRGSNPAEQVNYKGFNDIVGHWGFDQIASLIDEKIIDGYIQPDGTKKFEPENPVTRAEFLKLLAKTAGEDITLAQGGKSFNDVRSGEWYYSYVMWASRNNIVSGYEDGEFRPSNNITRQEMAIMIVNYLESQGMLPENVRKVPFSGEFLAVNPDGSGTLIWDYNWYPFNDSSHIAEWALEDMQWMKYLGIMRGDDLGNCNPSSNAKRAETAVILVNLIVRAESNFTLVKAL